MILLIDNYGNFSYSLYQLAGRVNSDIRMIKNDELTLDEIRKLSPQLIILSPGPGRPEEAGDPDFRRRPGVSGDLPGLWGNGDGDRECHVRVGCYHPD